MPRTTGNGGKPESPVVRPRRRGPRRSTLVRNGPPRGPKRGGLKISDRGTTYAGHIEALLALERERRKTLDGRALALAMTSTAFVGLTLTLSVLSTGSGYEFTGLAAWALVGSLALFVLAAVLGLWANMMRSRHLGPSSTLREMVLGRWTDGEVEARNVVANLNIRTIDNLRLGSNAKMIWIARAAAVQLAAMLLLIVAIAAVVSGTTL